MNGGTRGHARGQRWDWTRASDGRQTPRADLQWSLVQAYLNNHLLTRKSPDSSRSRCIDIYAKHGTVVSRSELFLSNNSLCGEIGRIPVWCCPTLTLNCCIIIYALLHFCLIVWDLTPRQIAASYFIVYALLYFCIIVWHLTLVKLRIIVYALLHFV